MELHPIARLALAALPTEFAEAELSGHLRESPKHLEQKGTGRKAGSRDALIKLAAAARLYRLRGDIKAADLVDWKMFSMREEYGWSNIHLINAYFRVLSLMERSSDDTSFECIYLGFCRHVLLGMLEFPELELKTATSLANELEKILSDRKKNTQDAILVRYQIACQGTDQLKATSLYETWKSQLDSSGPGGCKQDQNLQIMRWERTQQNFDRAIKLGKKLLESEEGHLGACADVREKAAIELLAVGLDSGDKAAAQAGYNFSVKNMRVRRQLGELSQILRFHFLSDRIGRAASLTANYLPLALSTHSAGQRFKFLATILPVVNRLLGDKRQFLRVSATFFPPKGVPLAVRGGRLELVELRSYCLKELHRIASKFDARNSNTRSADELRRTIA